MKETLRYLFQQKFNRDEYRRVVLQNLLHAQQLLREPQFLEETNDGDRIYGLGYLHDADGKEIGLYYTDVVNGDVRRKRVGFRQMMKPYVKYGADAAIAVFADKEHWRLSYMCDLKGGETSAKRFSYVFGDPKGQYNTPSSRLANLGGKKIVLDDLKETFSVEALSKEFFKEYHEHYDCICDNIISHPHIDALTPLRIHDYVKKMMGRIVFLHFLQKKRWLDDDPEFLKNLFFMQPLDRKADFLEQVLEPLFFGIFNTESDQREKLFADEHWDKGLLKQWEKLPYLNGGLFERDEVDKLKIKLPASLFEDLFSFMASYNFTVDENDPDDAEVGVDPEMLGKIFESLLEDNKAKGAFYTPKEIVRYMCKESLIAYLKTKTEVDKDEIIRRFVETHDFPAELAPQREVIGTALREVKICDPAIGSGAFPMGLLNELWRCREAIEETASRVELKKEIIENNIYGVDIEKGAIDIARLRFWLSIVVDAEKPEPLPNFDYKFMQGNSLVESYKGIDLSRISNRLPGGQSKSTQLLLGLDSDLSRKNLQRLMRDYFSVADHKQKASMRQSINDEVKHLIRDFIGSTSTELEKLNPSATQDFFLWHTWYKDIFEKGGFDIVIANPPYVKEYTNREAFDGFRETSPYYMGKMDLWYGFACHGIDMLQPNGILCFIAQNNWTTSAGAKKMRNKVVKDAQILQLLDFNTYMVFENADIQTMIMLFRRNPNIDNYSFDYRIITQENEKEDMLALLEKRQRNTKYLEPSFIRKSFYDKLFTFSNNGEIFEKIVKDKSFLNDDEVAQGIVFPQDFLNRQGSIKLGNQYPIGTGIFGLSQAEKDSMILNKNELELIKPYFTTEQIHKYYTEPNNTQWLIYTDSSFKRPEKMSAYPNIKKHLDKFLSIFTSDNRPYGLHRCRKQSFFQGEKIISLRKCVNTPCFSYSDFDCYVTQTFFSIKTVRWNMKFLTGVLNSKLIAFWLRNKGKMQGDNYQVDKEPLQGIPLPIVDVLQQQPIISLVDQILKKKSSDSSADTSQLEQEIDKQVYALYNLTPEEIAIIEQN